MNRIVIACLLASGCMKGGTDERTEAPPPVEPQSEAVYAAQPDDSKEDSVLATLDEVEAAYYADCSHAFEVRDDENDAMVDECLFVPFDQNCAPDPSGCWDGGQECISGCAKTCKSCDVECGGGCDGCKAKCKKDDAECVTACVETRVECHDKCMAAKETCSDTDCPGKEQQCNDAHEALVAKTCPKCEQIKRCVGKAMESSDEDPFGTCAKKFKREPDQCIEWCGELF